MAYEMTWEPRGLYRRYYGYTNDMEVAETTMLLESSPQFDEMRYTILDFLETEDITIFNASYIEEAAAIDAAAAMTNPRLKVAVVTVSTEIMKLAEAYIAHPLRAYPTMIFSTLDEARKWVAVELPEILISPSVARLALNSCC